MIGMILHYDLRPGDGGGHCGRLDLSATRAFRHAQKDRAAFQINGPCSPFKAEDRLRTQTGDPESRDLRFFELACPGTGR